MIAGFIIVMLILLAFVSNAWYEKCKEVDEMVEEFGVYRSDWTNKLKAKRIDEAEKHADSSDYMRQRDEHQRICEKSEIKYKHEMEIHNLKYDHNQEVEALKRRAEYLEKLLLEKTDLGEM